MIFEIYAQKAVLWIHFWGAMHATCIPIHVYLCYEGPQISPEFYMHRKEAERQFTANLILIFTAE